MLSSRAKDAAYLFWPLLKDTFEMTRLPYR
jgi:hypothetical protein